MIKILYYIRALNVGGAETFIKNVFEQLNYNDFQIDLAVQDKIITNANLADLIKKKNIEVFCLPRFEKNPVKHYKTLFNLIKCNRYHAIHYHANSLINSIPYYVSKKTNCPLIIHSHNSFNNNGGIIGRAVHYINRSKINGTINVSCSDVAGKWMFGNKPFSIIHNSINIDKYSFCNEYRESIRNEFSIDPSCTLIGHVGRITRQKNHDKLLRIFSYYHSNVNGNSKLLIVGNGPLLNDVKKVAKKLGILEDVIFAGIRDDVFKFYSAFDVFVFPSFFEGLPFTLVEAQASGCHCVISDSISDECVLCDLVKKVSLHDTIEKWSSLIAQRHDIDNRTSYSALIKQTDYDSMKMVFEVEKIYYSIKSQSNK